MGRPEAGERVFVSYAGPDRPWAEWAAQQLEQAGLSVELAAWDWSAGDNFVVRMNEALARCDQVVALLSPAYFARERFTTDEWSAVLAEPAGANGRRRLIPVRVAEVKPPPILRPVVFQDVFDLPEAQARQALLEAVYGPAHPTANVPYPGLASTAPSAAAGVRVPGSRPPVWNVRRRNPVFTGRESELAGLRQRLCSSQRALVQALHGMGGVGKTELAVEYAHLFANKYELVWWIDAERPELVGEQLTALGMAAGWLTLDASAGSAAPVAVLRRLQRTAGWLLVYDNAETMAAVTDWIPDGSGHVVITSRSRQAGGVAAPVEVRVLDRAASVRLVREVLPTLPEAQAQRLAAAVEDLPLALSQSAGLLADSGMTVDEYLGELAEDPAAVLGEGPTGRYSQSLAAVVTTAMRHLADRDEAAVQLLRIVAVLAPEPVPLSWLTGAPEGVLPQPLAAVAAKTLVWRRTLSRVAALGLARVDADTVQMHRLTQAIIARIAGAAEAACADGLLTAAAPDDERDPAVWPRWAELLPHLLVRAPATVSTDLRSAASHALYYVVLRGEYATARTLAERWCQVWTDRFGPDDYGVLLATSQLGSALSLLGEYEQARQLDEDTLARFRRVLGDDHHYTVAVAGNLAIDLQQLGEYEQARQLHEDTVARFRRVLGDEHPDTLAMAGNLATDLRALGEYEQARQLDEDTVARFRLVLGDDHPDTLNSARSFAADLRALGEYEQARQLDEDTLARFRLVLGDDHPDTLNSAHSLAADLRALGEYEQARQLQEGFFPGANSV